MKATIPWLGALLVGALGLTPASAQYPPPYGYPAAYPCPVLPLRQAPDTYGPGFYATNPWGQVFGPNYYLQPAQLPWNGAIFARQACGQPGQGGNGQQGFGGFRSHPYARSPRDFFMME